MNSTDKMSTNKTILRAGLLLFGVLCGSTAVIMIKASDEHPLLVASFRLLVASFRLLVAALVLIPFFYRDLKTFQGNYGWEQVGWSALPALALAIHFMSWVVGARMTQVANASLIANLTPVAMPFFVWIFFREGINRQEVLGTGFTLAGLVVLFIIGLGLIPTVFGHTILNYSLKFFRGQVVSVTNLTQPLFAGLLGFLLFSEQPRPIFYAAATLIVVGVLIVLNANYKSLAHSEGR